MSKLRKYAQAGILIWPLFAISSAHAQDNTPQKPLRTSTALEQMVRQDCGSCHGLTFKGGLGSPLMPENLENYSIADLTTIILDGLPGTAMPPWRAIITKSEAGWMARYLKTGGSD